MSRMIGLVVLHFSTIKTSKHKESRIDNIPLAIGFWVREAGTGSHWPIPYTLTEQSGAEFWLYLRHLCVRVIPASFPASAL